MSPGSGHLGLSFASKVSIMPHEPLGLVLMVGIQHQIVHLIKTL